METYKDKLIHFVYRKQEGIWRMVGRIVYETNQIAPVKKAHWKEVKVNALSLGESFTENEEFLRRLNAVRGASNGQN
jgi:hypothetical protein